MELEGRGGRGRGRGKGRGGGGGGGGGRRGCRRDSVSPGAGPGGGSGVVEAPLPPQPPQRERPMSAVGGRERDGARGSGVGGEATAGGGRGDELATEGRTLLAAHGYHLRAGMRRKVSIDVGEAAAVGGRLGGGGADVHGRSRPGYVLHEVHQGNTITLADTRCVGTDGTEQRQRVGQRHRPRRRRRGRLRRRAKQGL